MDELKAQRQDRTKWKGGFQTIRYLRFPLDLTELICREHGFSVDRETV